MKAETSAEVAAKLAALKNKRAELFMAHMQTLGQFDEAIKKLEAALLSHYLDSEKIDDAVAFFIAKRDEKEALSKKQKEETAGVQFVLDRIEKWFLGYFEKSGSKSVNAATGSAARTARTTVKVDDPEIFFDWVIAEEAPEMLEKRANKTAVEAYLEDKGQLPPGVSRSVDYTVSITRPKSR